MTFEFYFGNTAHGIAVSISFPNQMHVNKGKALPLIKALVKCEVFSLIGFTVEQQVHW